MSIFLSNKFWFGISTLAVFIYVIPFSKSTTFKPDLGSGASVFISTMSILAGIKIGIIAFQIEEYSIPDVGKVEQIYIAIGALAVIWLSVVEVKNKFIDKFK